MAVKDRRKGEYWVPNDPRTYVLPQDIVELDAAWDRHFSTRSEAIATSSATQTGEAREVDPEQKRLHDEAIAYVRSYGGSFGLILDIRADRRFGTKYMKLSPRQVEVILASRDREAAWKAERAAQVVVAQAAPSPSQSATEGWYKLLDVVYKVQKAVHGSGHLYAKALIVDDHGAHWDYAKGMVMRLNDTNRLTLEEAAAFGKLYGVCAVCGRTLTDEKSIAAGIGPICQGRLS